jgi:hypothetical protein
MALYDTTPSSENIFALTMRIYAIAMKVVIPASTSVFTVEPCSLTLKNFSMSLSPIFFIYPNTV